MTPIRKKDSMGAIGVYWAKEHTPSSLEAETLAALANSTAVAMQNIELHQDLQRKIEELERAAEMKDRFLLLLSHELRTPMNSILGWSSILKEECGELRPELRGGVESIHRNAVNEMRLIGDLLDTSQIIAGDLCFVRAPVDVSDVVIAAIESMSAPLAQKAIQLHIRDEASLLSVFADSDRLTQVVTHLLSNATKFSREHGEISIAMLNDGNELVLTVQDDGEGIEPSFLPQVFNRFQAQSSELTRRHGGLGLGLALVKSIVEAHGGHVSAFSDGPGYGSRFEVRLPTYQPATPSRSSQIAVAL